MKVTADLVKGVGEHRLRRVIDFGDDLEQLFFALGEVGVLTVEESVPLLELFKLLDSVQVHRADAFQALAHLGDDLGDKVPVWLTLEILSWDLDFF